MSKLTTALLAGALVLSVPAVIAAEDPISNRQAIMKNNSAAMDVLSKMSKGEAEFEATAAALALRALNSGAMGLGELFPEGSESGGETRAAPAIWEDRPSFDAAVAEFADDTSAAVASLPESQEELVATLETVGANCGSCHETFRLPRQ
jgi:cytochrome c556